MLTKKSKIDILGVEVDRLTINEAIERIIDRTAQPGAAFVTKPYVEFFAHDNSHLLNQAWLCLPDGVALQWAAYYQSTRGGWWKLIQSLSQIILSPGSLRSVLPEKFSGINFTYPLVEMAARHHKSIYLVGSPIDSDIEHTATTLKSQIDNINIVGTLPGRDESNTFSAALEKKLLKDLQDLRPDIVLIGIGFPLQEELILRILPDLDHGVLIGEGGTFDYRLFGGKRPKAPKVLQRVGLEWLWRLVLEPRRIIRQSAIPKFIYQVFRFTNR